MPPRPQLDEESDLAAASAGNKKGAISKRSKYGSIGNNNDNYNDEKLPLTMSMSEESLNDNGKRDDIKKDCEPKRIVKLMAVTILAVAILSTILYIILPIVFDNQQQEAANGNKEQSASKKNHHQDANDDDKDDIDFNDNPFLVDPVQDLGMLSVDRSRTDASPSEIWNVDDSSNNKHQGPLPTNAWYLNLISHKAALQPDESTSVYTIPYIIDTAAASEIPVKNMAGIRIHWPVLQASSNNMQMVDDFKNALVLGSIFSENDDSENDGDDGEEGNSKSDSQKEPTTIPYRVRNSNALSPLGVTLEWGGESNDVDHSKNDSTNTNFKSTTTASKKEQKQKRQQQRHTSKSTKPRTMSTSIVRGMPYATMEYTNGRLPTIYSYNGLAATSSNSIRVDDEDISSSNNKNGTTTTKSSSALICGKGHGNDSNTNATTTTAVVQKHLHLHFINSDFTWMVFFSRPVTVSCTMSDADQWTRDFQLNVVDVNDSDDGNNDDEHDNGNDLVVRVALLNQCTTGKSAIQQHCKQGNQFDDIVEYEQLLKDHAHVVPTSPQIDFDYTSSSTSTEMTIDWGAKTIVSKASTSNMTESLKKELDDTSLTTIKDDKLLMFALPHHQDSLLIDDNDDDAKSKNSSGKMTKQCIPTFHGNTCLVQGSQWILQQDVGKPLSFWAPRPPSADMIPTLAQALQKDIHYRLSANLLRGAADTYFSGKILARTARVVVIADELQQLANCHDDKSSTRDIAKLYTDDVEEKELQDSIKAAASAELPSITDLEDAIGALKLGVKAWLASDAEAPFVYDTTWGGLVNCGCRYVGKGEHGYCNNTFPDCPALIDVNEDFGNGYYNDHHYHYGYHLYAAAVVAKFDPAWAKDHVQKIMLYIRDFANPTSDDPYFPEFRQKDWYLGSSWASGIVSAENSPHGRNEESSSEAISAYEAMALFGSAMVEAYSSVDKGAKSSSSTELETAKLVRNAGQLLTATEVQATNRYWHVWSSKRHNSSYPSAYSQPVVGMLYDTMASFQTWFAPWAVVSYGIQLLPLTPVAERRDDPEWAAILYPKYKEACETAGDFCIENGWSILQAGLLATTGDKKGALKQAMAIPDYVFESQGGMGNSHANTIWFIATRKAATLILPEEST